MANTIMDGPQMVEPYMNRESLSGYTWLKPGNLLSDGARQIISPDALNIETDGFLRKFIPNLPYDPHYIRTHGFTDLASAVMGPHQLQLDLGNLEKGRPLVTDTSLWGVNSGNGNIREEMIQRMMDKVSSLNKISKAKNANRVKSPLLAEKLKKIVSSRQDLSKLAAYLNSRAAAGR